MREYLTKTIDGHEYIFSQFGAKQAVKYMTRLARIAGKPVALALGSLDGGKGKDVLDRNIKTDVLARALEALTMNLDQDETLALIEGFVGNDAVICDGKRIIFDTHYEGRLGHMFKVLKAALEVQYGNFFEELIVLIPRSAPKDPEPAPLT